MDATTIREMLVELAAGDDNAVEIASLRGIIEGLLLEQRGRNQYVLVLEVELTRPLDTTHAVAAADLLAHDVAKFLQEGDGRPWGYGRAMVEAVYAPSKQFELGDFDVAEVQS